MYNVVADVEKYPEFVPCCLATRQVELFLSDADAAYIGAAPVGARDVCYAEMTVGFKTLHDSYVSRVVLTKDEAVRVSGRGKADGLGAGDRRGPFQAAGERVDLSARAGEPKQLSG